MTGPSKPPDVVLGVTPAENVPSRAGEISAIASANAPFVMFDDAAMFGLVERLGIVTLTCQRPIGLTPGREVVFDRVVTANLRATPAALRRLRQAIEIILVMAGEPLSLAATEETQKSQASIDLAGAPAASEAKN